MISRRAAKSKGNQMEYSVRDSLVQIYPDIILSKQEGFVRQYDLISHKEKIVIECKKHKGFNWNELVKTFWKLEDKAPDGYVSYLIFQSNRQPDLVMARALISSRKTIQCFWDVFKTPFIKHTGNKNGK